MGGALIQVVLVLRMIDRKKLRSYSATEGGYVGWVFFDGQADGIKLTLQNCLLEQTRWVFMYTGKKDISCISWIVIL